MSINWKIVWQSRWLIMLAFVLAAAISATSFLLVPRQWEATAFIKIGHLLITSHRNNDSGDLNIVNIPITSVSSTIAEMMSPTFIVRASKAAGLPQDAIKLIPEKYYGFGRVDISAINKSHIIFLQVRADSPANADRLANAFVSEICKKQSSNIYVDNKSRELDMLRHDLVIMQNIVTKAPDNYSALQYYSQLKIRVANIKDEISFPFLENTKAIGGTYVLPRAVFPRPSVFVGLGILLWLIMSVSIIFWRTKTSGK